ncbi:unnamed protein product [Triticum turgidum subsp. durum]|uniref:F-box domain-containing protein n=1 Tax=Triticum turgidum subsp. durum TaxID=4567 RepID=A0A9R0VFJ7_TRITD|nr:unnamed protein product [Triticum turgidum subsp. durum]
MAGRRRSRSRIHASEDDDGATRPSRRRRAEVPVPLPDGGDTLSESLLDDSRRPPAPSKWLPLPLDMLWKILLLLPPKPSSRLRASAVSTRWRGIATDPNFKSQFLVHSRNCKPPPLLGVFERRRQKFCFTPVLHPPDRIPAERIHISGWMTSSDCDVTACRHGRVLAIDRLLARLVVFAPLTGEERNLPVVPDEFRPPSYFHLNASVLCAANGQDHVHGFCHKSPFKVALLSIYRTGNQFISSVYSSESGTWSDLVSMDAPFEVSLVGVPATLVGNVLYWMLSSNNVCAAMLEFDLDRQSLTVIKGPSGMIDSGSHRIIKTEQGTVGWVRFSFPILEIWLRKKNCQQQQVTTWLLHKTVDMHDILGIPPRSSNKVWHSKLRGYDEANNVIILLVDDSAYMVDLNSMKSTKLDGRRSSMNRCHPFTSFYPPDMAI